MSGFGAVFQQSPGVVSREIDISNIVPGSGSSLGGFAGEFSWGPVATAPEHLVQVASEKELISNFGSPTRPNAASFFTAASFLKYGSALLISRAISSTAVNAVSNDAGVLIKNRDAFYAISTSLTQNFVARYPGTLGNSLKVSLCSGETAFASWPYADLFDAAPGSSESGEAEFGTDDTLQANDEIHLVVIDEDGLFTGTKGTVLEKYSALSLASDAKKPDGTSLYYKRVINKVSEYIYIGAHHADLDNASQSLSAAKAIAQALPATDGNILGYAYDAVIENETNYGYYQVSGSGPWVAVTSEDADITDFYVDNTVKSNFDGTGSTLTEPLIIAVTTGYVPLTSSIDMSLTSGIDGTVTEANVASALDSYLDSDTVDVNLLFAYPSTGVVDTKLYEIVEFRKDLLGFISAPVTVAQLSSESSKLAAVIAKFVDYRSSSYIAFDSGPVYIYDRFHDEFIWIPAAGHVAGLCANTDFVAEPWFSPGGLNRGGLLGVTKLGFNPSKASRDTLFKNRINPIVSFPGEGIVLFGDKTALSKPSAFDRINVRRLFNILKKSISRAARYQLFEINDEFTRSMFRNMVEPFLRDIQGRRGVTAFTVICDETNNTSQVIDSNNFVGEVYVAPSRSINYITLNFVATRTGVDFSEIVG